MAVELSERAVRQITAVYQAGLGTELAAIEAERADGITLAVPASTAYYNRDVEGSIQGDAAHVEVFDGPVDFTQPYNVDTQRAVYRIPITVRATVFNRDGATAETMETRRRRYQVAMLNVILKNASSINGDAALALAEPLTLPDPASESDGEGRVIKFQTSVVMLISCEELI